MESKMLRVYESTNEFANSQKQLSKLLFLSNCCYYFNLILLLFLSSVEKFY